MIRRLARQWPWLAVLGLALLAAHRYEMTWPGLGRFLGQAGLYLYGLCLAAVLVMAALGIGFPLLKRLVTVQGRAEAPLFAVALGLGALSLLTLLAGVLGWLYPVMAVVVLAGGVVLSVAQIRSWRAWCRSVSWTAAAGGRPRLTFFYSLLLVATLICLAYVLTANAFTPPLLWDEAAYHLALPKLYAQEHHLMSVPYITYSNQPFNTEMLYTLALLLNSEVMASLVSLVFALGLTAGLWLFAAEAFEWRAAFLAVALFWTAPAVYRLAGTTLIEIPLAAYTFLSIWAFWRWQGEPAEQRPASRSGWLLVAGLMAGLAAGTKLTGALVGLILGVLVLFYGWRRRRSLMTIGLQVALLGGAAFLLALPWYLKSYAYTGNPVWPFMNALFGGRYWDALGDQYHHAYLASTNLPANPASLVIAPWRFTTAPQDFGSFPLGLFVLGLAPWSLLFRPHRGKPILYLAAIAGFFYAGWFLMTHQTRFLIPALPGLCVLSGYALHRLLDGRPRLYRFVLQAIVVALVAAVLPLRAEWGSRLSYVAGAQSRDDFLTALSPVTAAYVWANEHLPAEAKVLLAPYENRGYFLDRDYFPANPAGQRVLRLEQFGNAEALWRELKSQGFTHLLYSPYTVLDTVRDWPKIEKLLADLKTGYADPIYERDGVVLYRLH